MSFPRVQNFDLAPTVVDQFPTLQGICRLGHSLPAHADHVRQKAHIFPCRDTCQHPARLIRERLVTTLSSHSRSAKAVLQPPLGDLHGRAVGRQRVRAVPQAERLACARIRRRPGDRRTTTRLLPGSSVASVAIRPPTCHNRTRFTGSNTKWSSQTGTSPKATPYARNATLLATATIRRCKISFMQKAVITRPAARKPTPSQAFIESRDSVGRVS